MNPKLHITRLRFVLTGPLSVYQKKRLSPLF